jgi:AcrR family transcriptional regulator
MSKKSKIISQAMRLFAEKGYANASIAELAKLTQVAEGTIYYHFKTKETLFQSVLEDIEHTLIREFQNFSKGKQFTSGLEKIEQSIFFYFYLVGTREEMFLILHRYDAYEMAQINPVFREHFSKIYSFLLDTIQEGIVAGHGDGSIGNMDAGKSAFIIYAMVDGVARLKTFNLYDSSALYEHLILSCRNMLKP